VGDHTTGTFVVKTTATDSGDGSGCNIDNPTFSFESSN
jgi:hypothetical protein